MIFWNETPCSLIHKYKRFGGARIFKIANMWHLIIILALANMKNSDVKYLDVTYTLLESLSTFSCSESFLSGGYHLMQQIQYRNKRTIFLCSVAQYILITLITVNKSFSDVPYKLNTVFF